jgi:hypothetical protein
MRDVGLMTTRKGRIMAMDLCFLWCRGRIDIRNVMGVEVKPFPRPHFLN